jgi:glycerol kinase
MPRAGATKVTYGTGAFLLMNTGERPVVSANGLLSTVGWRLGPKEPAIYALEGSAFVAGAAVQWLRDGLRAGRDAAEIAAWPTRSTTPPASISFRVRRAWCAVLGRLRPRDPDQDHPGKRLAEISARRDRRHGLRVTDVVGAMAADSGQRWTSSGRRRSRPNDRLCQLRPTFLGVEVERPVTPRPLRSVRPAWPASASGSGPTRAHSSPPGRSTDGSSRR